MLNVVHNDMCAFAGVAPIILYHAGTKRVTTFAGTGTWPRAISRDYFMREKQGRIGLGLTACVVPSAADAWLSALRQYGTKTFGEVAESAIRIAHDGFPVHHFMARSIAGFLNNYRAHPMNREIYLRGGEAPKVGDVIVQHELGATLQAMADAERKARGTREQGIDAARDYFYRGPIAKAMVAYSKTHGGFFSEEDFATYAAREEPAPHVTFRNHEVYGCGPWSQGPAFLEALGILDGVPMDGPTPHSPDVIHQMVEALKLAFADRERYLGDPLVVTVPMERLLSPAYFAAQRARIDPRARLSGLSPRGRDPRLSPPRAAAADGRAAGRDGPDAVGGPPGHVVFLRDGPRRQHLLRDAERRLQPERGHPGTQPGDLRARPTGQPRSGQPECGRARKAHPADPEPRLGAARRGALHGDRFAGRGSAASSDDAGAE